MDGEKEHDEYGINEKRTHISCAMRASVCVCVFVAVHSTYVFDVSLTFMVIK